MGLARNVAFADVQGPFAGGSAWDQINPSRANVAGPEMAGPASAAGPEQAMSGNPVGALVTAIGMLVVLGWVISSSSALSGKLGVLLTPMYWLMSVLGVMVGIVVVKLLVARFPLPGISAVVGMV